MISLFCLARKRLLEEAQANIGNIIPFASEYVDDGFNRGADDEILKLFQENFVLLRNMLCGTTSITIFFILLLGTDSIEISISFKSWRFELMLSII